MSRIFISYRRDDSAGYAGRLYDYLCDRIGPQHIFRDIDALEPGQDFVEAIEQAIGACEVLIVVIGRQWFTSINNQGQPRLQEKQDFVRLEIEAGLKRGIRVLPVLVQGATLPRAEDLPKSIAPLSRRQAHELSDSRWQFDVERLTEVLEKALGLSRVQRRQSASQPSPLPTDTVPKRRSSFSLGLAGLWVLLYLVSVVVANMGPSPPPLAMFLAVIAFFGLV
jgi:hypothetical protein